MVEEESTAFGVCCGFVQEVEVEVEEVEVIHLEEVEVGRGRRGGKEVEVGGVCRAWKEVIRGDRGRGIGSHIYS